MEFFATIGVITVFVFIYRWVKSWAEKSLEEIEQKKKAKDEDIEQKDDEDGDDVTGGQQLTIYDLFDGINGSSIEDSDDVFVLDTSDDCLYEPVFEPLPATDNQNAIELNLELKKIGSYVRLYYHLKNVYGENAIPTFGKVEKNVRLVIYETEMTRRAIYRKYFKGKQFERSINPFNADDSWALHCATYDLRAVSSPLVYNYDIIREECFKITEFKDDGFYSFNPTNLQRTARLIKIEAINEAERQHFRGWKDLRDIYEESAKKYIDEIFKK